MLPKWTIWKKWTKFTSRTEPGKVENLNRLISRMETELNKKSSNKQKPRTRRLHR